MYSTSPITKPLKSWELVPAGIGPQTRSRKAQSGTLAGTPLGTPAWAPAGPLIDPLTGLGKGKSLAAGVAHSSCERAASPSRLTISGVLKQESNCGQVLQGITHCSQADGSSDSSVDVQDQCRDAQSQVADCSGLDSAEVERSAAVNLADLDVGTLQDDQITELDGSTLHDDQITDHSDNANCLSNAPVCDRFSDTDSDTLMQHEGTGSFSMQQLKAATEEISRTSAVNNLIAGVVLKGAVLPIAGDHIPTTDNPHLVLSLTKISNQFDPIGTLNSPVLPHLQAEQFLETVKAVLLKKKVALETSVQVYNVNAFTCIAAELIPQMYSMAFIALGGPGSDGHMYGIETVWELLVWIMETGVPSADDVLLDWTDDGVVSMKKLDYLMLKVLEEKISLAPNTVGAYYVAMRYQPYYTKWIAKDYALLRVVAEYAEGNGLVEGQFLAQTLGGMKWFLNNAAEQISRGKKHAKLSRPSVTSDE